MNDWSSESLDESAADGLINELRAAVTRAAGNGPGTLEPCTTRAGYWRFEFEIPVSKSVLESFANDRHGYRGHYHDSPFAGDRYNREIVSCIAPLLIETPPSIPSNCCLALADVMRSIDLGKVWPREDPNAMYGDSCSRWDKPQRQSNEQRFRELLRCAYGLTDEFISKWIDVHFDSSIHRTGPQRFGCKTIDFKGAWVGHQCQLSHTIEKKRFRAIQIHCFGAS